MRKVSLEMNLGRKSQARFPKIKNSNFRVKLIVPAVQAEPMPPLTTVAPLFGLTAKEFCEEYNYITQDYDPGFPLSFDVNVSSSQNYSFNFKSATCFNLFHYCFDFLEGSDFFLKNKMVLLISLNFCLIKNVENPSFFISYGIGSVKQILGSLRSYGFFCYKKKQIVKKLLFFRKKFHIYNTKFTKKR